MDTNKLRDLLFSQQTRLYCVLDGAAVPDLPKKLYEYNVPNFCLIPGKLPDDVIHVAPYVVGLLPNSEFSSWVFEENFGKNRGIFSHCRHSLTEMRRHFRALMFVHDEHGQPLIFRFYDPRVIRTFLPTCEADELQLFFGKVDSYFVESEDTESILRYSFENGKLLETTTELTVE